MTLSYRSMCMIPHQGIGPPLSSLFIIKMPFCGAQGREWKGSIFISYIFQSQKPDPMEKTSHTIRSRHACVWNFLDGTRTPFCMTLSFILGYGLFCSFFAFFYASGHGYIFFFFLFCIAHIFLHDEYEESCQRDGAFLCGWEACFCITSSVEVSIWVTG